MIEIFMFWVLAGAGCLGIEHGASASSSRKREEPSEKARRNVGIRLVLYGPAGWILLLLIYTLPLFVDSRSGA
jgi:hypothetical protein